MVEHFAEKRSQPSIDQPIAIKLKRISPLFRGNFMGRYKASTLIMQFVFVFVLGKWAHDKRSEKCLKDELLI